jgi:hypothetical protein
VNRFIIAPAALAVVVGLAIVASPSSRAETPEERGLAIAQEADQRDIGFGNFTADQLMVLRNKQGQESERNMQIKVLEGSEGEGDKSLIVFDRPRDVKGTALLTHSHKVGDDDQWLYLPALKRVKRISSSNKAGSFMGSEFAYEDLTSQEVEKYTYNYLGEEPCGALTCYMLERFPVDKESGYTRQVSWIDTEEYRIWRVENYDRKGTMFKTLTMEGYERYLDRYWRAGKMFMVNHLTGKSTALTWENYEFRTTLDENDFTKVSLKRSR